MTVQPRQRLEQQIERRKTPRAEASARYKRLRQEAEPPRTIAAPTESLFGWIHLLGRGVKASLAHLRKHLQGGMRRVQGYENQRRR